MISHMYYSNRDDPTFLCLLFIGIISIFKAYATFGDTFFYITLLMMYSHLTKYMRYGFFILVMMAYAMIIGPACFRTWIYKGTGNANFFYFITLLFLLSQTLLIVEFIYAKLKERHELKKQANN
jgi:phosphatidylinositol glycan class U